MAKSSNFINNEIAVYMTSSKLLAFSDKLNPASADNYATIHSQGEEGSNGRKVYSTIGVLARDFTNGTGDKAITAEANISPAEARYLCARVQMGMGFFEGPIFSSEKIFGDIQGQPGYGKVRKFYISRTQTQQNKDTGLMEVKRYPWTVTAENGRGQKSQGKSGSVYCASGTYKPEKKVIINLSDQDMYCLLSQVTAFIAVWEMTYGSKIIKDGRQLLDIAIAERANQQSTVAGAPQGSGYGQYVGENGNRYQEPTPAHPQSYSHSPAYMPQFQAAHEAPMFQQPTQPQSTLPPEVEAIRGVVVPWGKNKDKTLGQIADTAPSELFWFVEEMKANNPQLKNGAADLIRFYGFRKNAE